MLHVHECPKCFERPECSDECSIEPDFGTFEGLPMGHAAECHLCAALARGGKAKPTHYRIVSISLYTKDIEELDAAVAELKSRGVTKANRSGLIRAALRQVDLDKVERDQGLGM